MIKITKFNIPVDSIEIDNRIPLFGKTFGTETTDDVICSTGAHFSCEKQLEKLVVRYGHNDSLVEHILLKPQDNTTIFTGSSFPVLTRVLPIEGSRVQNAQVYLHTKAINNFHKQYNFEFIDDSFSGQRKVSSLLQLMYDSVINAIKTELEEKDLQHLPSLNLSHLLSLGMVREQKYWDKLFQETNEVVSQILDKCYAGLRNLGNANAFLDQNDLYFIKSNLPHSQLLAHPIFSKMAKVGILTPKLFRNIFGNELVVYEDEDSTEDIAELIQQRIDKALVSHHDVEDMPGIISLYEFLIDSGYNSVYMEYVYRDGRLIPTDRCRALSTYMNEEQIEEQQLFLQKLSNVLVENDIVEDLLSNCPIEFERDLFVFDDILKLEVIIEDGSACVSVNVGEEDIHCTIYLDFAIMSLVSNSLVTE